MGKMNGELCGKYIPEMVECARRGVLPTGAAAAHRDACPACRERWERESQLTAEFRVLRAQAAQLESSPQRLGLSAERLDSLMSAFDRQQQARPVLVALPPRKPRTLWLRALPIAAAVLLAAGIAVVLERQNPRHARPETATAFDYTQAVLSGEILSKDAESISSDDFIPVPYAPPLAAGELVRIVRTDLPAGELAQMGFSVDPELTDNVAADLVLGEDGYPRALHLIDGVQ